MYPERWAVALLVFDAVILLAYFTGMFAVAVRAFLQLLGLFT